MDAAVEATLSHAVNGLYISPDMWLSANYLTAHLLLRPVKIMHSQQPITTDFERFSDLINEYYHIVADYTSRPDVPALYSQTYNRCVREFMAVTDLSMTYTQIRRALLSAVYVAMAIVRKTINTPDEGDYPRIIPFQLEDMRITSYDAINEDIFQRILAVPPWSGWTAKLRAQRTRTLATLSDKSILTDILRPAKHLRDVLVTKPLKKSFRRKTHRTIRKSADLFQRTFGSQQLRAFLSSTPQQPFPVQGFRYNYDLIMRPKSLFRSSHILDTNTSTITTLVYNKIGERLCELCLYFEDTPILDTAVATVLHVQNEETEIDLLRAACVIDAPKLFYADPILPELKHLSDPLLMPTLIESIMSYTDTLPKDEVQTIRDATLPIAYRVFRRINSVGKQYFPLMRMCHEVYYVDFLRADQTALALLELVQNTVAKGEF
jgi:hypothetical protein